MGNPVCPVAPGLVDLPPIITRRVSFEVALSAEAFENRNPTRQRGTKQVQIFLADASGYEKTRNFKTDASGLASINKPLRPSTLRPT
jgi:hypothetical protein